MALWTRSGVATRPSRLGSSPRRTSISCTRSSKVALVKVAGSVVGFMGPLVSRLLQCFCGYSFVPLGLSLILHPTHGLRRGLHSCAASRLTATALLLFPC